jgi:hypothetical protein
VQRYAEVSTECLYIATSHKMHSGLLTHSIAQIRSMQLTSRMRSTLPVLSSNLM